MRSRGRSSARPFWLPAISYYVLAGAISAACFFVIWGILFEDGEEAPWVTAGIAASVFMMASVFAREVILRNARNRYLENKRRLDSNFTRWAGRYSGGGSRNKLSLRQHERLVGHILMKSQAARVLSELAEGHHEVFAICDEYLSITDNELRRMDVNSPRYIAFRKGRSRIRKLHKHHLLAWTEIQSKELLREAGRADTPRERVETAGKALFMLEKAIGAYPSETRLLESAQALREFISAVRFSERIAEADQQEADGDLAGAIVRYEKILGALSDEPFAEGERHLLAERVNEKLSDLRAKNRAH